jgi:hypothetical protein
MSIFDHPGNLGSVRGTLLTVLHADWPAYPEGDDFLEGLFQLTAFPAGTSFVAIEQATEQKWFENQWKEFQSKIPVGQSAGMLGPAGEFIPIKGPQPGQYEDDPDWMPFVTVPSGRITVTAAGREFVAVSNFGSLFRLFFCGFACSPEPELDGLGVVLLRPR